MQSRPGSRQAENNNYCRSTSLPLSSCNYVLFRKGSGARLVSAGLDAVRHDTFFNPG